MTASFGGSMLTNGFDVEKSTKEAFNLQGILFDGAIGGVFGGVQGLKKPQAFTSSQVQPVKGVGEGGSETGSLYSCFGEMSNADGIRYNQYWDDVAKDLDTQTRVKLNQWDYRPNADLYNKYKDVFDNPKYYNQETGAINWSDNRGFDGNSITEVLQQGTRIDRYGYDGGTFVSPEGTSYTERALPPGTEQKPYKVYEVVEPIEVQSGKIAPWFDEKGGGIQHEFNRSIADLLDDGIIREVK